MMILQKHYCLLNVGEDFMKNNAVLVELGNYLFNDDSGVPLLQLHQKMTPEALRDLRDTNEFSTLILFYNADLAISSLLKTRLQQNGLTDIELIVLEEDNYAAKKLEIASACMDRYLIKCYIDRKDGELWHSLGLNKLKV